MGEGGQTGAMLLAGIQHSQWCCDAFLNGTLKIAGVAPLAEQIPAELLEDTLPVPSLSVAVWSSDKTAKYPMPSLPQSIIDRYMKSSDDGIRNEFEAAFARVKRLGFNASVSPTGPPAAKRENPEKDESDKKRIKLEVTPEDKPIASAPQGKEEQTEATFDKVKFEDIKMKEQWLVAVLPGTKEKKIGIQFRASPPEVWIVNMSAPESPPWIAPCGFVLGSWWKGKWKHMKNGDEDFKDADVEFKLGDSDQHILLNNRLCTIRAAFDEHHKKKPAAALKIAYHDVSDSPTDTSPDRVCFNQSIRFVWKTEEGAPITDKDGMQTISVENMGGSISTACWLSDISFTTIIWAMKWSVQGLAPIRPHILFIDGLELLPNEAIKLA